VLGGTFDHLHAGHKIMLTVAAASAAASLTVGLSVDELLAKKKCAAQLQTFDARAAALRDFVGGVHARLAVDIQVPVVVGH
jgi:phosphopantetheine adenylyltransferase